MKYSRLGPGLTAWLLLFSAVTLIASGTARSATQYVVVQPIDVCTSGGASCAPFNTLSSTGNPAAATASTPIGFVDPTTNINITRAIWLQAGIDVTFLPIKQYNSPVNSAFPTMDYRTLHISCTMTSCSSVDFKTLSQGLPGGFPSPAPPLAPAAANAINMFFVNTLAPVPGTAGPFYGFAWLNGNGVAVAKSTFFGPLGSTPRFDTLAHEIGHNLNLDHSTFGAGSANNVMTAGTIRAVPTSSGCSQTNGGALYELDVATIFDCPILPATAISDQLILGNSTNVQQGEVLLSGFLNPIPNVSAIAGGGDVSFTVTYPKFNKAGGRAEEFIFALVLALPEGFKFGTNLFTQTGGSAQVFSFERLNGNNGQGNTNCLKPISGAPSIECLEIDFVVKPNPNPPSTCPAEPATCYKGTFTANTSISFTSDIIDKSTGLPATPAQLGCTSVAPLQCLDLTYAFSDLLATTTFFGAPVNGVSTGNSQLPDATVPLTIVDPATFPSVASLTSPPLTVTGFSQTPCTSTSTRFPPVAGGNPVGPD